MRSLEDIIKGYSVPQNSQDTLTDSEKTIAQNEKQRLKLQDAGYSDPTAQAPSFTDKLFGVLDVPGTPVRAAIHNTINDPTEKDLNIWQQIKASASGKDHVSGSDIANDLGIKNKWGNLGTGILIDILTDPTTYLTAGAGAIAKSGKVVKAADLALDMGKLADGTLDIAGIASKYGDDVAKIISDEGATAISQLSKTGAQTIDRALLKQAAQETGAKTGIKFMGQELPGTSDIPSQAAQKLKDLVRKVPGSSAAEKIFVNGPMTDVYRSTNDLVKPAIEGLRQDTKVAQNLAKVDADVIGDNIRKLLPDQTARELATIGINRQFGTIAENQSLREAYDNLINAREAYKETGGEDLRAALDKAKEALSNEQALVGNRFDTNAVRKVLGTYTQDENTLNSADKAVQSIQDMLAQSAEGRIAKGKEQRFLFGKDAGVKGYSLGVDTAQPYSEDLVNALNNLGIKTDNLTSNVPKVVDSTASKKYLTAEERIAAGKNTSLDIADWVPEKLKIDAKEKSFDTFRNDIATALGTTTQDLPEQVKKHISEMKEPFVNDESIKDFIGAYDKVLNEWKTMATVTNIPRFQVRNMISNKFLQWTKGMLNPEAEGKSVQLINDFRKLKDPLIKGVGEKLSLNELPEESAKLYRELVGNGVVTSFADRFDLVGKDAATIVGKDSKNILGKGYSKFKDFGSSMNEMVENQGRIATYIAARQKGASPKVAASVVNKTLYDYAPEARTAIENNVIKRVIPFYSWIRNNTPNMAEMLFTNPKALTVPRSIAQESKKSVGVMDSILPEYMQDEGSIALPIKDKDGNYTLLKTDSLFPTKDLMNMLDAGINPIEQGKAIGQMVNPILRIPVEEAMNYSLYKDRQISPYEGYLDSAPNTIQKATEELSKSDAGKELLKRLGISQEYKYGKTNALMDAKLAYLWGNISPSAEGYAGLLIDSPDQRNKVIGYLTGMKPSTYDEQELLDKKETSDSYSLRDAISKMNRDKKAKASLAELMKGGK